MTDTKTCTQCNVELPATTEYFYRNGMRLKSRCKPCIRANSRRYAEQNREQSRERSRRYNAENWYKKREYDRRWRAENRKMVNNG